MRFSLHNILLILLLTAAVHPQPVSEYPVRMAGIRSVILKDSFWLPVIRTVQHRTIPFGLKKCAEEGRMENFLIAGKKKPGPVRGKMPFDDTDLYKIIEGASVSLVSSPDAALAATLDSLIEIIRTGQEKDGYLTTWMTIDPNHPPADWVLKTGGRWEREESSHELYNAGHLFEAAAAHYDATGKRNFLDIALRVADLLVRTFGEGKLRIPPGHQIVETGLVKLYRITGNRNYLDLAHSFLEWRGDSTTHHLYGEYSQDHQPVVRQSEIVGHAVRAVYMYAGMTDVGVLRDDAPYLDAVGRIWTNMVDRKMYITGGIGATHEGEAFGNDFQLPNRTAYGETCAAIGDVLWNVRLFQRTGDAVYMDVIERSLYNGLLAGISVDGTSFFYVNPLEADSVHSFNMGGRTRQSWFDCSCCPTNLVRFLPTVPGLLFAHRNDTVMINLYASSSAILDVAGKKVSLDVVTRYPWNGDVNVRISPEQSGKFAVKFRIPDWARNVVMDGALYRFSDPNTEPVTIAVNGKEVPLVMDRGYAILSRVWKKGDRVSVHFPMSVRRVVADQRVEADRQRTALQYGPLVYCVEGIDNQYDLNAVSVAHDAQLSVHDRPDLFGGIPAITSTSKNGRRNFTAIPYYLWSNRGAGTMSVWLPVNEGK